MANPRSPSRPPGSPGGAAHDHETVDSDTLDEGLDEETLIQAAHEARDRAYAPYSTFQVGCALLAGSAMYSGANIENASYGLTLCAERTAIANAVMDGAREIEAVAVTSTSTPPASPCGMCLQSLVEFCNDPRTVRVILVNDRGERRDFTLADLLPHAFTQRQLWSRE